MRAIMEISPAVGTDPRVSRCDAADAQALREWEAACRRRANERSYGAHANRAPSRRLRTVGFARASGRLGHRSIRPEALATLWFRPRAGCRWRLRPSSIWCSTWNSGISYGLFQQRRALGRRALVRAQGGGGRRAVGLWLRGPLALLGGRAWPDHRGRRWQCRSTGWHGRCDGFRAVSCGSASVLDLTAGMSLILPTWRSLPGSPDS